MTGGSSCHNAWACVNTTFNPSASSLRIGTFFAGALVYCDNSPIQSKFNPLLYSELIQFLIMIVLLNCAHAKFFLYLSNITEN